LPASLRGACAVLVSGSLALALLAGCGQPQTRAERGASLFRTCTPCHGDDGRGSTELRAPAIAGLPEWYVARELDKFRHDVRGANPDDMEGHRMRPMARTLYQPGDLEAVAAHVAAMPPVPSAPTFRGGDVANGQMRFTTLCFTCHGPDARGNVATGGPSLVGQWDWYMVAQLRKFQSGMRGTHPADTLGGQMRAMSLTLEDSTAIHNVVAYIKTLPTR
jgi:cytochrome c553